MNILPIQVTPQEVIIPRAYMPQGSAWEVIEREDVFVIRPKSPLFHTNPNQAAMLQEVAAFEAQHPQLVEQYLGQYVAFYQGRMIGHDLDQRVLRKRVRGEFSAETILIRQVQRQLQQPLRGPAPRLAK